MNDHYQKISTAYHEAGHVLYALLKYCMVESVKLSSSKDFAGVTKFYTYLDHVEDDTLKNYFMIVNVGINYAGMISEKILYKKISGLDSFPMFLRSGSYLDNAGSAKFIKKYNANPINKKFPFRKDKFKEEIKEKLEEHWSDVELLAQYLLKNNKANYKNFKRLFKNNSPFKIKWARIFEMIECLYGKEASSSPLGEEAIKSILLNF